MRKLFLGLMPGLIAIAIFAWPYVSADSIVFAPKWRVGQSWKIQVFSRRADGQPEGFYHNLWKFKVTDKEETGGRLLYVIKAEEEERKTGLGYRFTVASPEMVLQSISVYRDGKRQRTDRPGARVFFLDAGAPSIVPLDFTPLPIFSLARTDRGKTFANGKDAIIGAANQRLEFRQEILLEQPVRKLAVATSIKTDSGLLESVQTWEEGKPWWSGARRTRNGVKESEAILIE